MLLELFISFFKIGLFSIGGGLAAMPLLQNQVVTLHQWLSLAEFTDLVTIAEMTPGPIAINAATFVGIRVGGFLGAIIATLGCILPPCAIVLSLSFAYSKYSSLKLVQGILSGLRPAIVSLIASAGLLILSMALFGGHGAEFRIENLDGIACGLFLVSFLVLRKFKVSPILIMIGCGIVGGIVYSLA